ncbi:LexA family transcriptional regulator [Gluconobacter sp. LMG 31484]|uniref:LexA family transcriptional regulator n=1 Tax=Gluconobacter vitians TaxID=2728102 RepID=A0ABR9Y8V4_9PROT|nr:LexA family transcriptional regulator [Gluconobacter vitians]MBF0860364.1 LexA family transcriptional regulator [Gluconobacter vitians]
MSDAEKQAMRERGERLRQAAQAVGITHAAKAAGLAYTTLRDYMNGQEMKFSAAITLARVCGVSLEWLAYGTGEPQMSPTSSLRESGDDDALVKTPARGGYQTVIPWHEAAGFGEDGLRISKHWLDSTLSRDPAPLRLLTVAGDAMSPTLRDGDLLIIDTVATTVSGGALYALTLSGGTVIRRLDLRFDGGLRILADNDRYPPQDIAPEAAATLGILGEIVWSGGVQHD